MAASQVKPRVLVLAGLAGAAAMVLVAIWPRGTADIPGSTPVPGRPAAAAEEGDRAVPAALGLEGIQAERAAPANRRDLFRFGSATPAPDERADGEDVPRAPRPRTGSAPPVAAAPPVPQGPPPEPIPLRYVLYADSPGTGRMAGLSDGRFTYQGREGDVIEGKWRIVKIGVESVVIERVDGTGRQALRLAGGGN